uniref:GON-4-like protein n=1 Tax=Haemonchus contortus TaxID=6289 RepID=A0A7I4XVJ0_HAECO
MYSRAEQEGSMDVPELVDPDEPIDSNRSIESHEQDLARIQEKVAFLGPLLLEEENGDLKDQQAMGVEEMVEVDDVSGKEEEADSDIMVISQEKIRTL